MTVTPYKILQEAVRAVPAIRFALAVAGIGAVVAIVAGFTTDLRVAVFGTIIVLGLMFVVLAFATLAKSPRKSIHVPAIILAWAFTILVIAASSFLLSGFFFGWPRPLDDYFQSLARDSKQVTVVDKGILKLIQVEGLIPEGRSSSSLAKKASQKANLSLVIEKADSYVNPYGTGLALSFCLSNVGDASTVVSSIAIDPVYYWDETSKEFARVKEALPAFGLYLSAPILVYGFQVTVSPDLERADVRWGGWDASAGSRGVAWSTKADYSKMIDLVQQAVAEKQIREVKNSLELLPPSLRFKQEPGATDCFHGEFKGSADGIYKFGLRITYHADGEKREIRSSEDFAFASISHLRMIMDNDG